MPLKVLINYLVSYLTFPFNYLLITCKYEVSLLLIYFIKLFTILLLKTPKINNFLILTI